MHALVTLGIEFSGYACLRRTVADHVRIRAVAKYQAQRFQHNGLARTGLSGQDRQLFAEFDFYGVDNCEIANLQVPQHRSWPQ